MANIKWNEMGGNFITVAKGTTTFELRNWRQQTKFKDDKTGNIRFGLTFDVYKENNFTYDDTTKKEWTCTALKACKQLQPIIEKAEKDNKASILVKFVKAGEGKNTIYDIEEVEKEEKIDEIKL